MARRLPSNVRLGVAVDPAPSSSAAALGLKKGVLVDVFTEDDWWQARAKSKPDPAGFVHLGYLNGVTEDDVALRANSPRIRAAQASEDDDCDAEMQRARGGEEVLLWSEYAAARKEGAPLAGGGVLAQLRRSLEGQLALLEAFVPPEGVAFAFPTHSVLVDELARQRDGTGLGFLSEDGAAQPTELQAQRLSQTKVLQGWARCLADPLYDAAAVREPRRSEPAQHQKARTKSKKPPPPDLPFDVARTSPALNSYLLLVVQNWSLLKRGDAKTRKEGVLLSQLSDLIAFLHPWELPHLTAHHVAHAIAAWCVHYGELGLGVLGSCPETCPGGVMCTQFVALDRVVSNLRQAHMLKVAQGWMEGAASSNFRASETGKDALFERCSASVKKQMHFKT